MLDKRKEIMEVAMKRFSEKGYLYTSMQEIAVDCGMSKGSLYKFFSSKEELLIQVFKYNHDKMIQKANYITIDQSLAPKEKLKQRLVIEYEGILENKDYFNLITKTLPDGVNQEFKALMKQIKTDMLNWHKGMLQQIYGDDIKQNSWDLVVLLQGVLKEFMLFIIHDKKQIEAEKVADFIVFSIDAIVQQQSKPSPVLTNDCMHEFDPEWHTVSPKDKIIIVLDEMKVKIPTLSTDTKVIKELENTVSLLKEELQKETKRDFLIHALINYLEGWKPLVHETRVLKELVEQV